MYYVLLKGRFWFYTTWVIMGIVTMYSPSKTWWNTKKMSARARNTNSQMIALVLNKLPSLDKSITITVSYRLPHFAHCTHIHKYRFNSYISLYR